MQFLEQLRLPHRDHTPFAVLLLLMFVVPIAFYMGLFEKFEILKLSVWSLLLGWCLAALVLDLGRKKLVVLGTHRLIFGLLLLQNIIFVISAVFGQDQLNSFFGYYPRLTGSVWFFLLWSFTFVAQVLLLDTEKYFVILKCIVVTACISAVVGLAQSMGVGFYEGLDSGFFMRAPGLLGNPNFSSLYVVAMLPIIMILGIRSEKLSAKLYYGLTAFACIALAITMSSRGAWLGLIVELALCIIGFLIFRFPKKFFITALATAIVAGFLGFMFVEQVRPQTLASTVNLSESNINLRFFVWDIARSSIMLHPWLGVGPGNFHLSFQDFRDKSLAAQNGVYDDAHNLFLQLGATAGLPFLLVFICMLAYALFVGLKNAYIHKDPLAFGLVVGLVGFLVMACFTPVPTTCWLLLSVFLTGLVLPSVSLDNVPSSKTLLLLGLCTAISFILLGAAFLTSEVFLYRGYNQYLAGKYSESIRSVRTAARFNPTSAMTQLYIAGNMVRLGYSNTDIEAQVNKIISLHPEDARSYAWAANLYFLNYNITTDLSRLTLALSEARHMIERDPYYARRVMQYAIYLFANNNLEDSLEIAKYSLSLDSDNVPGWLLVARIYQLQDRKEPSVWALEQVLTKHPEISALKYILMQAKQEEDYKKVFIPVAVTEGALE